MRVYTPIIKVTYSAATSSYTVTQEGKKRFKVPVDYRYIDYQRINHIGEKALGHRFFAVTRLKDNWLIVDLSQLADDGAPYAIGGNVADWFTPEKGKRASGLLLDVVYADWENNYLTSEKWSDVHQCDSESGAEFIETLRQINRLQSKACDILKNAKNPHL